jgi:hypothetical protein
MSKPFKFLCIFLTTLICGAFFISLLSGKITSTAILTIFDEYIRLVLSSWPATTLILGLTLFIKQHEAIAHFIKNRMTGVGFDGVKGTVLETATLLEIKAKTMDEEKEVLAHNLKREAEKVNGVSGIGTTPTVEDAPKDTSIPTDEKAYKRLKKVTQIEEIIQTGLIQKYADRYRPQVKLSIEGKKSLIIDGLLYSKKGNKATAVEIKYLSPQGIDALRFIISRKIKKYSEFGIRKLVIILIMDEISESDAIKIQEQNIPYAQIYFYKRNDNELEEVKLPTRNQSFL